MTGTAWQRRVLSVVRRIPPGRVATYGEVATLAGRPRAARAVGNIMRGCGRPDVPCHRVIAAGGRLGGYGGSEVLKRSLLVAEGIVVRARGCASSTRVRWPARRAAAEGAAYSNLPGMFPRICLRDDPKQRPPIPFPSKDHGRWSSGRRMPGGRRRGVRDALPAAQRQDLHAGQPDGGIGGRRRGPPPGDLPAGLPQTRQLQRGLGARHVALSARAQPLPRLRAEPAGENEQADRDAGRARPRSSRPRGARRRSRGIDLERAVERLPRGLPRSVRAARRRRI